MTSTVPPLIAKKVRVSKLGHLRVIRDFMAEKIKELFLGTNILQTTKDLDLDP